MSEQTSEDAEDLYDKAVDHVAEGDLEAAVASYREALAIDAAFADAWEGLSMALAELGKYPEALAAAHKVVELTPDEQLAYTNLSRIYMQADEIENAEAWAAKGRVLEWKRQLKESENDS